MTEHEAHVAQAVTLYVMELRMWLSNQGYPEQIADNPLIGQWRLSDGAGVLTVDADQFTWHRHTPTPDGDAYRGTYQLLPGALTHQGFVLDRGQAGAACYSMVQHYTSETVDHATTPVDRQGLFFIKATPDPDRLSILNHRTGSRFTATRLTSAPHSEPSVPNLNPEARGPNPAT